MPTRKFYSRLAKKEEERTRRKTLIYLGLTVLVIIVLILYGIPALTRFATFLSDSKKQDTSQSQGDELPIPAPKFYSIPEATNSAYLLISGYTNQGSTVSIFLNGSSVKEIKASDGFFTNTLKLDMGTNEIYGITTDESGGKSNPSDKSTVVYETSIPELTITEPQEGAVVSIKMLKLSGKTVTGATLSVNDHLVLVNSDGTFTTTVSLNDNENTIKIISTSKAGNTAEKELKVTYTKD